MSRIALILGALLVAFSFVPAPEYVRPLVRDIDLSTPNRVVATFDGARGPRYLLGIEVDAAPEADCLLGAFTPGRTCPRPAELDVSWTVHADGVLVEDGRVGEGRRGSDDQGGRRVLHLATLGPAPGPHGVYAVSLDIRSPAATLAGMAPALAVDAAPEAVLAPVLARAAARVVGGMLFLVALVHGLYSRLRAYGAARGNVDASRRTVADK